MSIEEEIEQLRQTLPCLYSNPPHILDIHENEGISIVAADRPDKAVVIGPGGYIAGHLAKLHQKPLTITAYTDELVRDFRKEEARKLLRTIKVSREQKIILEALKDLLDGKTPEKKDITVAVALSGGRDSLASAILLNKVFHLQGLTVYPSDIILPRHVRDSLDEAVKNLDIDHEYIPADFSPIVERALSGRIHPCGHCHRKTYDILVDECVRRKICAVTFGELLPTGSQSLRMGDVLIINLPAFLALTKRDTTNIASAVKEYPYTLGCPLLKAVHRRFPFMKYATAERIFREVRAGILEPGEALKYVKTIL